jgi:hypothetical protein
LELVTASVKLSDLRTSLTTNSTSKGEVFLPVYKILAKILTGI